MARDCRHHRESAPRLVNRMQAEVPLCIMTFANGDCQYDLKRRAVKLAVGQQRWCACLDRYYQ